MACRNQQAYDGQNLVACGYCDRCRKSWASDWMVRLKEETKVSSSAYFITLTYDDEHVPWNYNEETGECVQSVRPKHVQDWMKRIRKFQKEVSDEKLKYFLVGEYGDQTLRPHYHLMLFNLAYGIEEKCLDNWTKHQGGWINDIKPFTHERSAYITDYSLKKGDYLEGAEPPFTRISNGIGLAYVSRNSAWHKNGLRAYYQDGQYKKHLPRYYMHKLFTEEERRTIREHQNILARELEIERFDKAERVSADPIRYLADQEKIEYQKIRKRKPKKSTLRI